MQRLRIGPLLKDIVHKMKRKVNGSEGRKMFLYSAHDTTVASLLNTLEVFNDMPPPYASAVIMELWKNTSSQQYYFKVHDTWIYDGVISHIAKIDLIWEISGQLQK